MNQFFLPLRIYVKVSSTSKCNLHTHIIPVYHFVLDFQNRCPHQGQNNIHTYYPCTILSLVRTPGNMCVLHFQNRCPHQGQNGIPTREQKSGTGTIPMYTLLFHMCHLRKSSSLLTDDEHDVTNVMHKIGPCFTNAECTDPKRNFE